MSENEKQICVICKQDRTDTGEGYHEECYLEVLSLLSDLAGMNYQIKNCIKDSSDKDKLEDLKDLAETLLKEIEVLLDHIG